MSINKPVQVVRLQDDNRVFVDMADSDENPCLSCGACCQHFRVSMYMGEMASSPGGTVPDEWVSAVNPFIVCMKGTEKGHGRCIALRGAVGKPGIRCEIYHRRPTPCREYRVWLDDGTPNPDCQRLRANIGLAPLRDRCAPPREAGATSRGELPDTLDTYAYSLL
jgi:Fe-S-cluster containining protein